MQMIDILIHNRSNTWLSFLRPEKSHHGGTEQKCVGDVCISTHAARFPSSQASEHLWQADMQIVSQWIAAEKTPAKTLRGFSKKPHGNSGDACACVCQKSFGGTRHSEATRMRLVLLTAEQLLGRRSVAAKHIETDHLNRVASSETHQ